jgi:hypothetical protein
MDDVELQGEDALLVLVEDLLVHTESQPNPR